MADLKYTAEVDTSRARQSLDGLKDVIISFGAAVAGAISVQSITNVSSRFEDLRTTLQLLYRDSQIGAAAFEDIKKFAESSIFSVENLTETVVKLKAAGLEPTVSLLRLFADTSSVAADSVGALQAITDLYARTTAGGLGLEDLNRLADRGIPVFTILSERLGLSRLEISKVGQTAEGASVILKALEEGLQDAFGGASANRANNVSQAFSNFGDSVANAADAMGQAGLNKGITDFTRALTDLLRELTPVIAVIGKGLGEALSFAAENMKVFAGIVGFVLGAALKLLIIRLLGAVKLLFDFGLIIKAHPIMRLASIIFTVGTALGLISAVTKSTDDEFSKFGKTVEDTENKFKVFKEGNLGAGTQNLRERVKDLNAELNKFRVEMNAVITNFARYNQQNKDALLLETDLIGTSRENQNLRRNEQEINKRLADEIARLTEVKAKLTEEERKQGRAGIIDQTIKKLQEQAAADIQSAQAAIQANEAKQRSDSLRLFGIQQQVEVNQQLRKIQDDIAKSTMSEIQKREYDILAAARERANQEIRAEEVRRGSILTDQEKLKYYEAAKRGTEELINAERRAYSQSREFSTGWKRAFNEYIDNATNAAQTAQRLFQRFTSGLEDLIVNFTKTGKFAFRDFASSIIEEILRAEIRLLASNIFKTMQGGATFGGSGGIFGGSIIPGILADGGAVTPRRSYVVGERGPELFIPEGAGRMIPNNQLGSNSVTYNINAVDAASFRSLVARDPGFIHAVAQQGAMTVARR